MKIALINENSQAAKNEMICSTLKSVVEPMGHEVFITACTLLRMSISSLMCRTVFLPQYF